MNDLWWYKKHIEYIESTSYLYTDFRNKVFLNTVFKESRKEAIENTIFDWENIDPHFYFFFDFDESELIVSRMFMNSGLCKTENVYVETLSNVPIIKVPTQYFIKNWYDFVRANVGMGSFVISDNFEFLMEFTDDEKYELHSNFKIQ